MQLGDGSEFVAGALADLGRSWAVGDIVYSAFRCCHSDDDADSGSVVSDEEGW